MDESSQFGRYQVMESLGEGGMGALFKAMDPASNQPVAIKIIGKRELDEESLSRFRREGEIMTRLSHPNVISVLETGQEGENHFIVMEFIEGQDLKQLMASLPEHRSGESLAISITGQIAQALSHVHQRGIIHRDIKPANIMLTADMTAKLTDFGIAKSLALSTLTRTGDIVGTAAYMPPEQALGDQLDARSDLYALGCVLFELLAGRRAFPGDNAARVIFSQINDTPTLPRRVLFEIKPTLEALLLKLLAKDPNQRFQSADELLEAIALLEAESDSRLMAVKTAEGRWAQMLIGRDKEIALLRERLDATLRAEGSLVFLAGDLGVGKSRLAHQLETYARMRGVRFYSARGSHQEERVPYRPWIDLLRAVVRTMPLAAVASASGDSPHYLVKLLPEMREQFDEIPELPEGPPDRQRAQLFDAITHFFVALSQESPLVLFLDDLQWIDEASLQLLGHIVRHIPTEPLFILGAYREEDVESQSQIASAISGMSRERNSVILSLKPLNAEQAAEMVRRTFGGQELLELESFVFEKSEGNPFFVEELLRSMLGDELIVMGEKGWEVEDIPKVKVPSGIQAVIQDRLARVSEACRSCLALAAVIGREFDFQVLQAVMGADEIGLVDLVDEALQAHLLAEQRVPGAEVYAFAHKPTRDVLYESISPVKRRRLHLQVATAIEQVYGTGLEGQVERLAYHFREGNDTAKAAAYFSRAGDKAEKVFAWEASNDYYESALELLAPQESERRAEMLLKLATVAIPADDYDASLAYAKSALKLFEELDNKPGLLRSHMHIQMLYGGGAWDGAKEYEALEHLREMSTLLENEPDTLEKGLVYQRTAHVHLHLGEPDQALAWTQKSVDLYERLGIDRGTALGTALSYTGSIDEGVAYSEGNWQGVRELGNPLVSSVFGHELALTLILARNVPKAQEWAERVYQKVAGAGRILEGTLYRPLLLCYTLLGDLEKANELRQAEEDIERHTLMGCYFEDTAGVGLCYLRQGLWSQAEAYLESAILAHQDRRNHAAVGACSFVLGHLHLEQREYAKSEAFLLKSLEICRHGGNVLFEFWILPLLVELYLKQGKVENAAQLVDRGFALMKPDQNWYGLPGLTHLAEGMLASAERKWSSAEESFGRALDVNQRYRLPWDEAKTLYEWGLMYDDKGDKDKAREKLDAALALFQEIGAEKEVEKTLAAKERLSRSWFSRIRERMKTRG